MVRAEDKQFENEISLPLNTKMTLEDAHFVAETFAEILGGKADV